MSETADLKTKTDINPENVEAAEEKKYTFRQLSSTDIFIMFKIIGKIGLKEFSFFFDKDIIRKLFAADKTDGESEATGITIFLEVADVIIKNLPKCENEIYQLLSQTSNLSVEEIKAEGNAIMFVEMVMDFLRKEEFPGFFKAVSRLFK